MSQMHESKMPLSCRYDKKSLTTLYKQNLVSYIVHINLTSTNTLVSVTDIKGNVKLFYSSGQVNLKGKQKTKQPAALINILKRLFLKAKFMQNEPLAIHFKNTRSHYEAFIVKMLKTKFFIKTIRSYNMQPHNGCRPKKIKRF
uniref:Ribosomal protein S11 n=1 Tax=Minutocellus polymorphus TaxID=265543 RepID=A0A8A6KJA0_9STRA|nr:ribosomal protein S11 [Minutocellus polymorphus]QTI83146.1 ribosomal protein S11 [Minutocellus polymorphus]